jgi:hypothetical protein
MKAKYAPKLLISHSVGSERDGRDVYVVQTHSMDDNALHVRNIIN